MEITDRHKDFMTLYLKDDLLIIPVDHFGSLLDHLLDESMDAADFINTRVFLIDERVAPTIPMMLPEAETLAVDEFPAS